MWHKAEWMGHPMRLELTRVGLLVNFAKRYTTKGALTTWGYSLRGVCPDAGSVVKRGIKWFEVWYYVLREESIFRTQIIFHHKAVNRRCRHHKTIFYIKSKILFLYIVNCKPDFRKTAHCSESVVRAIHFKCFCRPVGGTKNTLIVFPAEK